MTIAAALAPVRDLVRSEPRARRFLAAHAQSSLGTGAACVALLVLAHERFVSPWAIALVLLADMVPPMLLGPLLGAAADRWSRRSCAVVADVVRALAFAGIALVDTFPSVLAFALVAGLGTALARPALLAALPSLVSAGRLPAATSLFGALDDLGFTLGPALSALALVLGGAELVLLANAASFAVSAVVLARLPFGARPTAADADDAQAEPTSLFRDARDGVRAATSMPAIPTLILASSGIVLFAGLFNVGELLLATDELGAGASGYAVLVAIYGLGITAGSLAGARGGDAGELSRRYVLGLLLTASGFLSAGLAPSFALAVAAFGLGGVGNGLVLVHERLLFQTLVPDRLLGRVFSLKDTLQAWAFAPAFVGAATLASLFGARTLLVAAGIGAMLVWAAAASALRRHTTPAQIGPPSLARAL